MTSSPNMNPSQAIRIHGKPNSNIFLKKYVLGPRLGAGPGLDPGPAPGQDGRAERRDNTRQESQIQDKTDNNRIDKTRQGTARLLRVA